MKNILKICLLAAGKGTRNTIYKNIHKSLLPIGDKPVIDYIFKNIPKNSEIIVACGHLKKQIQSFFSLYDFNFKFVDVQYDGPGTGPGHSLLECSHYINEPFIFLTVDTIFDFPLTTPKYDWAIFTKRTNNNIYCNENFEFDNHSDNIFSGLAGIYNYKSFFYYLKNSKLINNQKEVISSLGQLNPQKIFLTTYDTGNNESYLGTIKKLSNIELKKEEFTIIVNNKVIKFNENKEKIDQYVVRYNEYPFSPNTSKLNEHMFFYDFINGEMLSNCNDLQVATEIINKIFSTKTDGEISKNQIDSMYKNKTKSRIELNNSIDIINGYKVYTIEEIISKIDWNQFYDYIPCIFHGDLQPENIIIGQNHTFIDPRISFGGNTELGDLYYELGKIYHALFVNGGVVRQDLYTCNSNSISFYIKSNLLEIKNILKKKCLEYKINWNKVVLIGLLQYINIYSLYKNEKYKDFLYKLGILKLSQYINGDLDEVFN